jgi:hypothetical protein
MQPAHLNATTKPQTEDERLLSKRPEALTPTYLCNLSCGQSDEGPAGAPLQSSKKKDKP